MLRTHFSMLALVFTVTVPAHADRGVTLQGSRESMVRQNRIAMEHALQFLKTAGQVEASAGDGSLATLEGNDDYMVLARYPYAQAEIRTFIERFSADYRAATGHQLVVTSLTRPSSKQPSNASPLSVHPAGMAVDLRVPLSVEARAWLESELLRLEAEGVLDVTRERNPPHYHLAIFPSAYMAYLEGRGGGGDGRPASLEPAADLGHGGVRGEDGAGDAPIFAAEAAAHESRGRGGWLSALLPLTALSLAGVARRRRRSAGTTGPIATGTD